MNLVVFTGRIVNNAELKTTPSGQQVCEVRFAVREDRKPESRETLFLDLNIWGNRAEKIAQYLTKGKPVAITGRLEVHKSQKDDKTYCRHRVIVNQLEFLPSGKSSGEPEIASTEPGEIPVPTHNKDEDIGF